MTEPQLIFLHQGAFRKGRLVDHTESRYVGLDIQGNCVLDAEDISPLALQFVYATSLSPRLIKKTEPEINEYFITTGSLLKKELMISADDFRERAWHIGSIVHGIVDEAKHVALDSGLPYFSVAAVSASTDPLDMDARITEKSQKESLEAYLKTVMVVPRPARVIQYTLHPTVQLYVPR